MLSLRSSALLLAACVSACGAQLILPAPALERDGIVPVVFRTAYQATGKGALSLKWTDQHGRTVDDREIALTLTDEPEFTFTIDLRRARAISNRLTARFRFQGKNAKGEEDKRDEEVVLDFLARPPDDRFTDYRIIMWQQYPAKSFPVLKQIGINAGQYVGRNKPPAEFLLTNDLQWYAENIATDFYAEYHRYRRDRRVNAPYYEAKDLYRKDPTSKEAFKRHPSLSDPKWLKLVRDRLVEVTRNHFPYRPIFYDLGDESGIADLSAYWDFDFSDFSLTAMRDWLRARYPSLDALNAQWGSTFTKWEHVTPDTTDEAMRRGDNNYSSWADHKEWMDEAFARALRMGTDAIQSIDPNAFVGIAGAQMPGWGGYDYWKLTRALNFFEPYNIGNNIEMIRSFSPATPVVTTSFARGPQEKHRVWYELLHGSRGLILWDDKFEFADRDKGTIGPRGEETKPYFQELRRGLGSLLIHGRRMHDPIAIHYSQASFRTAWMRQHQPKGSKWVDRNASTERLDSDFLRLRESYCRLIEDLGLQYRFVAYEQLELGELLRGGYKVLMLPDSLSLSEREAQAIREFVAQGGTLITNAMPGTHDEHSRKLLESRVADLFPNPRVQLVTADLLNYHQHRLLGKEAPVRDAMAKLITAAGVAPAVQVFDEQGSPVTGVETHLFANGAVRILGLHANPQLRVNELGPPEFKSNERFEKPRALRVTLPSTMHAYDLRAGKPLGAIREIRITLDPYEPALFALSADPIAGLEMSVASQAKRGDTVTAALRGASPSTAATHVVHVDVIGPDGVARAYYSANVAADLGVAGHEIPFALNDPAGAWTIRATDILTGRTVSRTVRLD
ncbi:MAG: beta-galactosidase [Bryobacterales bacterium]|nr:beta-galactosidase [Bryobacterales bacterium]